MGVSFVIHTDRSPRPAIATVFGVPRVAIIMISSRRGWMDRRAPQRPVVALALILVCALVGCAGGPVGETDEPGAASCVAVIAGDMITIEGGSFEMGDLFGEGEESELPIHEVTLDTFLLGRHEITRQQFAEFVEETGYRTSAQAAANPARQEELTREAMPLLRAGKHEEAATYIGEFLSYGGCFWWSPETGHFDFSAECNWRDPRFAQTGSHPVIALSWIDAAQFCNWLSRQAQLPAAYALPAGDLLDAAGEKTTDLTAVQGYRLPSEAEWEFAARERGRRSRFGNGQDIARSSEIVFDASRGEFDYLEVGPLSEGTKPVGSHRPNALGLCDMSGNAWEWCSDFHAAYEGGSQVNPHASEGRARVLRGGRWGGTAKEMRVSARAPYEQSNRCNNSGFRLARSLGARRSE